MTEKTVIELLNQLFEIEKKSRQNGFDRINRNLERMKWLLEQEGFTCKDPTGEQYNETRMDCQATILKDSEPYTITDTIKPVIFFTSDDQSTIVQQARVIIN